MKKAIFIISALITINTLFAQAPKNVLLEEFTGTWCGYCPRGIATMETIMNIYPNVIGVSNHCGLTDSMRNSYTTGLSNGMNVMGYPGGLVDRYKFSDQTGVSMSTNVWTTKCVSRLATTSPVGVEILSNYNSSTRSLAVTVTAKFVGASSGDLRINCLLVEDSVTGVGQGYDQKNYMGNGCTSPDPASPWYSYPCTIVGFQHRHVVRDNIAGLWGTSGIIPSTVSAHTNYSKTYNYTLPASWDESQMTIVAFISKHDSLNTKREVLNAAEVGLGDSIIIYTGFNGEETNQVELKQNTPNPFSDITAIQFKLKATDNVSVKIYNLLGEMVATLTDTKLIPGEHIFYWDGNDTNGNAVKEGVYIYRISTTTTQVSGTMIRINTK